jgi:hypothetical protein
MNPNSSTNHTVAILKNIVITDASPKLILLPKNAISSLIIAPSVTARFAGMPVIIPKMSDEEKINRIVGIFATPIFIPKAQYYKIHA